MALDMAKYRRIFLEEATDHLAEISRALLGLEKDLGSIDAIDTIFRMAHSVKSMAASLGYDAVADLSHQLEDRMEGVRAAGCVRGSDELALLFRGLEALESMVLAVSEDRAPLITDETLLSDLAETSATEPVAPSEDSVPTRRAGPPDPIGGEPKKVRT